MKAKLCAIVLTLLTVVGVPTVTSAVSADAALSCSTTTYRTVGKGTCEGSGYWRVKVACQAQGDKYSSRIYQSGGTVSQYAECRFNAQGSYAIIG